MGRGGGRGNAEAVAKMATEAVVETMELAFNPTYQKGDAAVPQPHLDQEETIRELDDNQPLNY